MKLTEMKYVTLTSKFLNEYSLAPTETWISLWQSTDATSGFSLQQWIL